MKWIKYPSFLQFHLASLSKTEHKGQLSRISHKRMTLASVFLPLAVLLVNLNIYGQCLWADSWDLKYL